jgi:glyoxalase family protein
VGNRVLGIHHVTAICSDAQQNVDFYSGVLGLRLVKRTVNFDDPGTYHLYYGDGVGHPGTILTFFSWPGAGKGRLGNGQITATSFAIPVGSLAYWQSRLREQAVPFRGPDTRFGDEILAFEDPDGMTIELITSTSSRADRSYADSSVPAQHAIRGFHSATFSEAGHEKTASLLTGTLGLKIQQQEGNRYRYSVESSDPGSVIDILVAPGKPHGRVAVGSVHHIAWRATDDQEQADWLKTLTQQGHNVSPVMDRVYFHSIYFPEPGGILFEIATDGPGFTFDEPAQELGSHLKLPPWLESDRAEIERLLPALDVPVRA